ncbi:4-alpha-glucanotransferase [Novosphingobium panipatense]
MQSPRLLPQRRKLRQGRLWGPALQIPALRGRSPQPFGAFGELAEAVAIMAARGADAVAINPVHALFPGDGEGFSPYSPSSRLYLNGAMGDPALVGLAPFPAEAAPEGALIDWEAALPQRLQQMRALFRSLDAATRQKIADESAAQGKACAVRPSTTRCTCTSANAAPGVGRTGPLPFTIPTDRQ